MYSNGKTATRPYKIHRIAFRMCVQKKTHTHDNKQTESFTCWIFSYCNLVIQYDMRMYTSNLSLYDNLLHYTDGIVRIELFTTCRVQARAISE